MSTSADLQQARDDHTRAYVRVTSSRWLRRLSRCVVGLAAAFLAVSPARSVIIADNQLLSSSVAFASRFPAVGGILTPTGNAGDFNLCTGTLVTPKLVLTAAHCFDAAGDNLADFQASSVEFRLGSDVFSGTTQKIGGSAIHLPTWDGRNAFDIALLELARSVTNITPMRVTASPGGNTATLVGFGLGGDGTTGLQNDTGGVKRAAVNRPYFDLSLGKSFLLVDFDQPGVPDLGSGYRDGVDIYSRLEGTGCPGDSGSPLVTGDLIIGVLGGSVVQSVCNFGTVTFYPRPDWNRAFLESHGVFLVFEPAALALFGTGLGALGVASFLTRRSLDHRRG
ncbi:hypothetical protein DFH01_04365 [Falsiroseomonas bella]|uniref:Peptidase S1 domain-containing protein n=1 Tax=Falsiroseomonas bella TaxID=2184016 RepID=A0A317FHP0_9PROT|nr:hypothetical protein DFH01_04365 [Falsiroseomonas bella]